MIQLCKGNHEMWGYSLESQLVTTGSEMFVILSIFDQEDPTYPLGVTSGALSEMLGQDLYPLGTSNIQAFIFEPQLANLIQILFRQFIDHTGLALDEKYKEAYENDTVFADDIQMEACL